MLAVMRSRGVALLLTLSVSTPALAYLPIYEGPTWSPDTGGYNEPQLATQPGQSASDGAAVGSAYRFNTNSTGSRMGLRPIRWDPSGWIELQTLGTNNSGATRGAAIAINSAGTSVGYATKYAQGTHLGHSAVRWDAAGAVTELSSLGTTAAGVGHGEAVAINAAGLVAGVSTRYSSTDQDLGSRTVRWNPNSTTAIELDSLQANSNGFAGSRPYAMNDAGLIVGSSTIYTATDEYGGSRAVRWEPTGTAVTQLGLPSRHSNQRAFSAAYGVNSSGDAVGTSSTNSETVALRWNANTTTPIELPALGPNAQAWAVDINDAGVIIGQSPKVSPTGSSLGSRAVRWENKQISELPTLGVNSGGYTETAAYAINSAGPHRGRRRRSQRQQV